MTNKNRNKNKKHNKKFENKIININNIKNVLKSLKPCTKRTKYYNNNKKYINFYRDNYTDKNLNFKYLIKLGLHLSNNYLQNRKIWIHNFILGSRGNWDILNITELLKYLQILGPILILLVKKGGTILIISNKMTLEVKLLSKMFSLDPYIGIVHFYLTNWLDGAFTNFFNFKLLNLRQLPTLLFLLDFTNNINMLNEAYFLRIPVIALTDLKQHIDFIFKKIVFPIPANTSIKTLFFFFNFLRYNILKGLYFYNYIVKKDIFFKSFITQITNLKYSLKNKKYLQIFLRNFASIQKQKEDLLHPSFDFSENQNDFIPKIDENFFLKQNNDYFQESPLSNPNYKNFQKYWYERYLAIGYLWHHKKNFYTISRRFNFFNNLAAVKKAVTHKRRIWTDTKMIKYKYFNLNNLGIAGHRYNEKRFRAYIKNNLSYKAIDKSEGAVIFKTFGFNTQVTSRYKKNIYEYYFKDWLNNKIKERRVYWKKLRKIRKKLFKKPKNKKWYKKNKHKYILPRLKKLYNTIVKIDTIMKPIHKRIKQKKKHQKYILKKQKKIGVRVHKNIIINKKKKNKVINKNFNKNNLNV